MSPHEYFELKKNPVVMAILNILKGVLHLQKLACFVIYLKIINNFLKNKLCIL